MADLSLDPEKFNVFVAYDNNRIYAEDCVIPWQAAVKGDFKFLNKMTTQPNVALIMGRLTHESIGKPLKDRVNVVVSNTLEEKDGIIFKKTFSDAVNFCKEKNYTIVIFGGRRIYQEAMKSKCKFFITIFDLSCGGNKEFPEHNLELQSINEKVREIIPNVEYKDEKFHENGYKYSFYQAMN